jgi:lysozyme
MILQTEFMKTLIIRKTISQRVVVLGGIVTKKVGILRGAYHVFRPEISGKAQSKNFMEIVPKEKNSLPPAVDLVSLYEVDIKDKNKVQKEIRILLTILENHYGKKPIIYVTQKKKYVFVITTQMI